MDNVDLSSEDLNFEFDSRTTPYFRSHAWPITMNQMDTMAADPRRNISPIQTNNNNGLRQTTMGEHPMMEDWRFQQIQQMQQEQQQQQQQQQLQRLQQQHHQQQQQQQQQQIPVLQNQHLAYGQQSHILDAAFGSYDALAMTTQMSMIPVTQALSAPISLDQTYMPLQTPIEGVTPNWAEFHHELISYTTTDVGPLALSPYQQHTSSPTGSHLEVLSQRSSNDDPNWLAVEQRFSFESDFRPVFVDPTQTLHDRTLSESSYDDLEQPVQTAFLRNLEMGSTQAVYSPATGSDSEYEYTWPCHSHDGLSIEGGSDQGVGAHPATMTQPIAIPSSKGSSPVRSPGSQTSAGSCSRKAGKKSPIVAKGTERITKKTAGNAKTETEKRVGRRKGPLSLEQRKQAGEIRKLRACLRCKFLKKTCDKGDPCAGCQPSHARLWQVPCTRIDIKDIGYFLKDKKFDYERHVSLGFSIANIKGISEVEKTLWITHGYGHMLPVTAREVYVCNDKCLKMDWIEANKEPLGYEVSTANLSASMQGISVTMLSDYLDRHLDGTETFPKFVDDYFEGTPFLSQMLKAAHRFYTRTQSKIIKKALKLMLAYSLTLHITMVEGVPSEEGFIGKIEDKSSKFYGKTMAPVMINFQIKVAMADMWRGLHKDVLEELSSLYSSVYSGDKLKNWPTIFMLASVLLAVWECMQFDCHYRVPDEATVDKFCTDMETTPVGVIVGLFSAISQKLPSILEWDTAKHHALLNSNWDVCETMTEVREHVSRHESYLRDRPNAKFDSKNFESLSNKFLSRLVLRDVRAN